MAARRDQGEPRSAAGHEPSREGEEHPEGRGHHPFRVCAYRMAILATRSSVSSLGAQDITQGSPRSDPTVSYSWLVSSHEAISRLLRDPRMSVENRDTDTTGAPLGSDGKPVTPPFLFRDPPHHNTLRQQAMYPFAPRITGMRPHIETLVTGLLDKRLCDAPGQLDVVADLVSTLLTLRPGDPDDRGGTGHHAGHGCSSPATRPLSTWSPTGRWRYCAPPGRWPGCAPTRNWRRPL